MRHIEGESLLTSARSEVATGVAVFFAPAVAVAKAVAGALSQPVQYDSAPKRCGTEPRRTKQRKFGR